MPTLSACGNKSYDVVNGVKVPNGFQVSALPFRAYQLIYNEYYRDQNLTEPIDFTLGSGTTIGGDQLMALMSLRRRAWEKTILLLPFRGCNVGPKSLFLCKALAVLWMLFMNVSLIVKNG